MDDREEQRLREEFGSLCEEHRDAALRIARARLGGKLRRRLDSHDLLQETFLTAARIYPEVHDRLARRREGFTNWLARLIENKVRELARRHGRLKRDVDREIPMPAADGIEHPSQLTPGSELAAAERRDAVREAVRRLPPRQRQVIELVDLGGLPVTEAAERMGKTPNATWVLRSKALQALGRLLGDREI